LTVITTKDDTTGGRQIVVFICYIDLYSSNHPIGVSETERCLKLVMKQDNMVLLIFFIKKSKR